MILSDRSIKEAIASGRLGIDPFDPELVQPSSVDVRLDRRFLVFRNTKRAYIDVKQPADDLMEMIEVGPDEPMFLHPHEFVLGSTIERVRMPNDLVARLEGRSSLGRLGVVIHSSLPYDEPVLFLDRAGVLEQRPIGELVEQRVPGKVLGFDRDTFEVGFHEVTNWFKELPDEVYEVRLASGRSVRVTAGHNLFSLDRAGNLVKTPTGALMRGSRVAIPKLVPDMANVSPEVHVLRVVDPRIRPRLLCHGPTVDEILARTDAEVHRLLRSSGLSVSYYVRKRCLPLWLVSAVMGSEPQLCQADRLSYHRSQSMLPAVIRVDREFAWLLGLYVAEGHRRHKQVNIANTNSAILDRAERAFEALGQRVYRNEGSITCCSVLVAALFEGLGMGRGAATKRLPTGALGWPPDVLQALLDGVLDGDGSRRAERDCLWTTSTGLASQVLLAAARLGQRAVTQTRPARPRCLPSHVVSIAKNRHKVLTAAPNPSELLIETRRSAGLSQVAASRACGFRYPTSLNNIEKRGAALHVRTLERLYATYTDLSAHLDPLRRLGRLVDGGLQWDEVVDVVDTGRFECVYDLEVRAPRARVENFLAGSGGVFVSNTAGFIDPEFEGHVTLEISNLANLPIALYPGMRIGQISFSLMTTPAERPYGAARGSKYSGQQLPTASRLYLDFRNPD